MKSTARRIYPPSASTTSTDKEPKPMTSNTTTPPKKRSFVVTFFLATFKLLWTLFVILIPLLGVWVSSSIAAYLGGPVWLTALCGLLLFPVLPLLWEWRGHRSWARRMEMRRKNNKPPRTKLLTVWDRLILRTLTLNLTFLTALIALTPQTGFTALATRGDWMLDTNTGPLHAWIAEEDRKGTWVQSVRSGLFRAAGGLEWMYNATRDNPYDTKTDTLPDDNDTPAPDPNEFKAKPIPDPDTATPDTQGNDTTSPSAEKPPNHRPKNAWPLKSALHPAVSSIPSSEETSLERVARYLVRDEKDPVQRVKALHDYVADRIQYDAPALARGEYPPQDPQTVFKTRRAVCAGYAKLLAAMGKVVGEEILYIVGDSRDMDGEVDGSGHAWNAVKISEKWYLIDATWDAGYVENNTFHKRYKTDYFLTPPQVFVITHYPKNEAWQLLEKPISRGEFIRQPMMDSAFYAGNYTLITPNRSQVSASGSLDIQVRNPNARHLMGHVRTMEGKDISKCEVSRGDITTLACPLPNEGRYRVEMFDNAERFGRYGYIGQIHVNAR